jgi:hypothetical protein
MTWPDYFPTDCPPNDSHGATGKIFRLVPRNRSVEEGFRCQYLLYPDRIEPGEECNSCGLSVSVTLDDCLKNRKLVRSLKKKTILSASFDKECGKLKDTSGKIDNHYTWWVPSEINEPWIFFAEVDMTGSK